jgi:hypothetical protein
VVTTGRTIANTATTRAAGGYRLIRTPVVFVQRGHDQEGQTVFSFTVHIRLNKHLPRDSTGFLASLHLDDHGSGGGQMVGYGRKSRHCYAQPVTWDAGTGPADVGRRTSVKVHIRGVKRTLTAATIMRSPKRASQTVARLLNCGRGLIDSPE